MAPRKPTKSETDEPPVDSWLTRAEAARALRTSVRTIQRMQERKELQGVEGPDGEWRFDPADLAILREEARELTVQEVMQAAVKLADQSQAHAEAFGKLVLPNSAKMIDMLFAEIADLRERAGVRIAELERKLAESFEAREAALSQAHERQIEMEAFKAEEARKTQMLGLLENQVLPKIMTQVQASGKVASLLRTIEPSLLALLKEQVTDEQWEALQTLLNDDQRGALAGILAQMTEAKKEE